MKHSVVDGVQRISFDKMTLRESEFSGSCGTLSSLWGICRQEARAAGVVGSMSLSKMVSPLLLRISGTGLEDILVSKKSEEVAE
jgi:hypothetical protein